LCLQNTFFRRLKRLVLPLMSCCPALLRYKVTKNREQNKQLVPFLPRQSNFADSSAKLQKNFDISKFPGSILREKLLTEEKFFFVLRIVLSEK